MCTPPPPAEHPYTAEGGLMTLIDLIVACRRMQDEDVHHEDV
jgi:hypothetical protein